MNGLESVVQGGVWNLLVVDADPGVATLVRAAAAAIQEASGGGVMGKATGKLQKPAPAAQVRGATSLAAAEAEMLRKPANVMVVNLQTGDNGGVHLIARLKERYPKTEFIAVSRAKRTELCLDAWRAGAADMLLAPFGQADVKRALENLAMRQSKSDRAAQRHQRLRDVCRRLNKARHEISQQVDLLCNDLVRAYQEMAQQLNLTQTAAEFAQALQRELDVEGVLRKTMEWILMKLGPLNAAIYLPSGEGHFALGAYLNLDTQADALLIEAMGRTIVEQARGAHPVILEDDQTLEELFGEDARTLLGRQWLAIGCQTPRECLAVLTVFRVRRPGEGKEAPGNSSLAAEARGLLEAIGPILAERIEQALGLYQRLHPFPEEEAED